jgi:hypothetical protein
MDMNSGRKSGGLTRLLCRSESKNHGTLAVSRMQLLLRPAYTGCPDCNIANPLNASRSHSLEFSLIDQVSPRRRQIN